MKEHIFRLHNGDELKVSIEKYAEDILIGLSDEEIATLLSDFTKIKADMENISSIPNIENVSPMSHPYDLYLAKICSDEDEKSLSTDEVLANCDNINGTCIEVPKVVGSDE